jgi:hypothetical protein
VNAKLSATMTPTEFVHGYWYAVELKEFAKSLGIAQAGKLRKDEIERAITRYLHTGRITSPTKRSLSRSGIKDVDRGLTLRRRVVLYTNDRETKDFLEREAVKRATASTDGARSSWSTERRSPMATW